jgi:hypothetical protein
MQVTSPLEFASLHTSIIWLASALDAILVVTALPLAVEAIAALPMRSCVIDGEAIVCDDGGLPMFDLIRGHGRNGRAILCAFDYWR